MNKRFLSVHTVGLFLGILVFCFLLPPGVFGRCNPIGSCSDSDCGNCSDCCFYTGDAWMGELWCDASSGDPFNCRGTLYQCIEDDTPCGCFLAGTEVNTSEGKEKIEKLKTGEEVIAFDSENNEEKSSLVEKVHKTTRSAYYKIKLQDEKEVEVTGEHPLYAIRKEKLPLTFREYLKTESLIKRALDSLLK